VQQQQEQEQQLLRQRLRWEQETAAVTVPELPLL
jgi:hypothetical protein